ncbi:hypothetical protein RDWZM_005184 [Blomia tropicalis]|uniref:Cyclin N-terminal domain-containing protein n=1 Tax=Blomia tropicalis TaxID=40697 RepID=A0A9Q0M7I3_BLOTA|nr:hypothetical protein RDWZM_005184 [Blomia tropicalis]
MNNPHFKFMMKHFLTRTEKSHDESDKILDENIEAVKKELDSFLIDSLEKDGHSNFSTGVFSDKENESMMVDIIDDDETEIDQHVEKFNDKSTSLIDSVLDKSEISFFQYHSPLDRLEEYADSILPYMLEKERRFMPDPFYMTNQANINSKMRSILVDWLVDVADEYNIKDETLFLTVNYIDRFLSKVSISRQEFQLLGTAALFVASKYEEIYPPEIGEFVYITDDSFTKQQILQMEKLIFTVLEFDVSVPTSNYFLEKYLSDLSLGKEVYCLSKYLCFLSMLECQPFLKFYPSEIALCSILLAAKSLNVFEEIPTEFIRNTLNYERSLDSNGDIDQFLADRNILIEELNKLHLFAKEHPQQVIQRKYSSSKYYKVAGIGAGSSEISISTK